MKNYAVALFFLGSMFFIFSCQKSNSAYTGKVSCNESDDTLNTYGLKIASIINTNCATIGCHDATSKKDGVDLSTYVSSKNAFENKNVLCSIYAGDACKVMPVGGIMSEDKLHDITCWVKNGYPQ